MKPTEPCVGCHEPMVRGRCLPGVRQHEGHGLCRQCYEAGRYPGRSRASRPGSGYGRGPHGNRAETRARDAEIAALKRAGRATIEIAYALRTTERTVQRALARHRARA